MSGFTNRLVITIKNFSFVFVKQLLEPMRSLVAYLKINFGFTKIGEQLISIKKHVKRLMSYVNQYGPKLFVWLTSLVLKKKGQNHVESR